jgi:hypothetical protein
MKIVEPIVIRKVRPSEYRATGKLEGYGTIRRQGRTEEEAKERFFQACDGAGTGRVHELRGRRSIRTMNV